MGNVFLPTINPDHSGPWYASLAGSHFNLALRCIKNGTQSPVCDLTTLMDQKSLKDVVLNGHRWWILPETLTRDQQTDISLWRNMDQNENNCAHEIEVLQTIAHAAHQLMKAGKQVVKEGDLIAVAQRRRL